MENSGGVVFSLALNLSSGQSRAQAKGWTLSILAPVCVRNLYVRHRLAMLRLEVLHALQHERRNARAFLRPDVFKAGAIHLIQDERRPPIPLQETDLHVRELNPLGEIGRA